MATVSARWTIELVCNLTVGGVSRSHPQNLKVASLRSPDVNQPAGSKPGGIGAEPAQPSRPPPLFIHLGVCVRENKRVCVRVGVRARVCVTSNELKVGAKMEYHLLVPRSEGS